MDKQITRNLLQFKGFYLFSFFAVGSLTPLLSVYLSEVEKMNGYQIGTIMSAGPIAMMIMQPIWGMVCDWSGKPAKILSLTTLLAGVLALGYLFIHDYQWLVIIAIILAVFQSAIIPVSDGISLQYATRVKANYGNLRLYGSLGFALAVFIMGRLAETTIGLSIIFYSFFITLVISAYLALRLPEEPQSMAKPNLIFGVKELLSIKRFLVFLAITFLIFGPNLANNVYYGLFIEDRGGTYTGIGIAFLLAVLSEIPFMRAAGSWVKKIGLLPIVLIAAFSSLLRWALYYFEPSLNLVYFTSVMQGLSIGLFVPAGLQYLRKIVPVHIMVTAITFYSAIGNGLGNWFSTFTAGIIMEKADIYTVYLFFAVLSLFGVILTLWLIWLERKINSNH
ncbi:MFS transporter [Peribacillus psychrosaccharolyticus]|uniref:MFS transporter n=1 Tax=Peribacillus psychrosaccharolyticus TaxID=1407 RepID=A0A974S1L3_PERPY|nr:MFS transporter [Peribacillus psychrosaccharolyticus]MEC2056464.1 MFS transporter [Peribacillus psychrosaccharolyticus]MED3745400.1 MFS transporter [Peribacillus psychrosaccharolyticus]QQT00385.1 MFS transporter [Peribacillus psychrosaccharolyticus]